LRECPYSGGVIENKDEVCELETDLAAEASATGADG
jgi:hypothetical protein